MKPMRSLLRAFVLAVGAICVTVGLAAVLGFGIVAARPVVAGEQENIRSLQMSIHRQAKMIAQSASVVKADTGKWPSLQDAQKGSKCGPAGVQFELKPGADSVTVVASGPRVFEAYRVKTKEFVVPFK